MRAHRLTRRPPLVAAACRAQSKTTAAGRRAVYFERRRHELAMEEAQLGAAGGVAAVGATAGGDEPESYDVLELRFLTELAPSVHELAAAELLPSASCVPYRGAS
jgi:hypothetical protein